MEDTRIYGSIYKITNQINNKIYIGQTIKDIQTRFKQHIYVAIKLYTNTKLYKAIRKHGADKFIINQIDSALTREELDQKETYYINLYNSYIDGYNSTLGGEDNPMNHEYVREKQKKNVKGKGHKFQTGHVTWKGKTHSIETKKKMSDKHKGKKFSVQSKKKMSETRKRLGLGQASGIDHHSNIEIVQLDKSNYQLINYYPTISDAEKEHSGKSVGAIYRVLNKDISTKTYKGFKWMRKTDYEFNNRIITDEIYNKYS